MQIRKRITCGLLILCCLLMTGCEKMKELTAEEEEIITLYAAKVVAKHNVRLSQGIVRHRGSLEDEEEAQETETPEEVTEEEPSEDGTSPETVATDEAAEAEGTTPAVEPVTLTDAMGFDGVTFSYKGASVPESLRLASYYTLPDPAAGDEYVIVTYEVRNTTESPQEISIARLRPAFTVTIDGESAAAGIVLEDDLSTYEGTIEAGGAEDLILLFEVSEEAAADLSSLELAVNLNGTDTPLILN